MKHSREFLGQHELLVMLAVLRPGRDACRVPIAAEIADRTGREMLQGSVYARLERLEAKGGSLPTAAATWLLEGLSSGERIGELAAVELSVQAQAPLRGGKT